MRKNIKEYVTEFIILKNKLISLGFIEEYTAGVYHYYKRNQLTGYTIHIFLGLKNTRVEPFECLGGYEFNGVTAKAYVGEDTVVYSSPQYKGTYSISRLPRVIGNSIMIYSGLSEVGKILTLDLPSLHEMEVARGFHSEKFPPPRLRRKGERREQQVSIDPNSRFVKYVADKIVVEDKDSAADRLLREAEVLDEIVTDLAPMVPRYTVIE